MFDLYSVSPTTSADWARQYDFLREFSRAGSARHVAPSDIPPAGLPLAAFLDHPPRLGLDQIEHRVTANPDEAKRLE